MTIFKWYSKAFFLSFGLGCLSVVDDKSLSIEETWTRFCQFDNNFPFKYAVYHKLRSKGWILKNGLKYGCDFSNLRFKICYPN